jgi:2-oxoglutarate dehydrogenase complex dehydrogenase (E1) component-like enzyme
MPVFYVDVSQDIDRKSSTDHNNLLELVSKYRDYGHKKAFIDPLKRLPRFFSLFSNVELVWDHIICVQ